MSAAVDVSSSDASPRFQPFTDRDTGRREAMPPVRRSFLAIVGGRRHYAAAELLQQVIYLIEWRDCRSLSVRYLADNLDCHRDVIQTGKSRLLELGFIQLSKGSGVGGADRWYLCVDAILEALDAAGYEATRAQLLGRPNDPPRSPDQSDSSNRTAEPDDPPSGRAVRSDSPNRTAEPDKQYLQEQDNTSDSSVADGRGREADQERSDADAATAQNIQNLEEYIRKAFDDFGMSIEHAETIREKLVGTFGLSERAIRSYIKERRDDFLHYRSDSYTPEQIARYITTRSDLEWWNYIEELHPVATSTADPEQTGSDDQQDQRFCSRIEKLRKEQDLPFDEAVEQARAEARQKGWPIPDDWKDSADE
jgi:hypothetical protein